MDTKERHTQLDVSAVVILLALCACWGLQQVSIKVVNGGVSPMLQAGVRSAGSLVLLLAWSAFRGVKLFERDGSLGYGLLIGVLFAGEFLSLYSGLSFTTASRSVIFLYTSPFVVAIGAHLFIPGERLHVVQVVGLLCAFAGLVAAFANGLRLSTHHELIGDVMVLGAALFWGATTVVVKASRLSVISPNKTLVYQLASSAVILPVLSVLVGEPGVTNPTPLVLGALAYQILIVAFISYLAWFWLISKYPASKLAAFLVFTPLFGMLAGAVLLSERVTGMLVLAMLFVGSGIYLVNRASSRDTEKDLPSTVETRT